MEAAPNLMVPINPAAFYNKQALILDTSLKSVELEQLPSCLRNVELRSRIKASEFLTENHESQLRLKLQMSCDAEQCSIMMFQGLTIDLLGSSITYGHRLERIGHPVRSAFHKLEIGELVVRWVTTGEYPLLYVILFFC